MASWRPRKPPRIEPPEWYRNFHPEAWDEPDPHELSITGGRDIRDWPGHAAHSRRRWAQAQHAYRQQHPALSEQEFNDLIGSYRERHSS